MPLPKFSALESLSRKGVGDVINQFNVNDFLSQPSPHELTATSELRVQEMIEDLTRRTAEEIENWSIDFSPEERFGSLKSKNLDDTAAQSINASVEQDMVRTSVSLSPPFLYSSSTRSNDTAVLNLTQRPTTQIRSQIEQLRASEPMTRPVGISMKANTQIDRDSIARSRSPISHIVNVRPRISIVAQGHPHYLSTTPLEKSRPRLPPSKKSALVSATTVSKGTPLTEKPSREVTVPTARESVRSSSELVSSRATRYTATRNHDKDMKYKGFDKDAACTDSKAALTKGTPSPTPTPTPNAAMGNIPKIKRKPLPADSPLRVSLRDHPAFAKARPHSVKDSVL